MTTSHTSFPTPSVGAVSDPIEITVGVWDELGAAIRKVDPKAFRGLRASIPQRIQMLNAAAQNRPDLQPLVNQVLRPMLQRAPSLIDSAAKSAAVSRRVKDTADKLETATHITPVHFDALANAGSDGAEVSAPHNGQPWRYLGMFATSSATVGTRISKFSLASTNHVVTDNVKYTTTTPTKAGLDLSLFAGNNQLAAMLPRHRWQPWGLKSSGVIRPDGKILIDVENRSGAAATMFIGLMLQSTPCGEQAQYLGTRGGVYRSKSKAGNAFMKKLIRFSMF